LIWNSKKGLADFITNTVYAFIMVIVMYVVYTVWNAANALPIFQQYAVPAQIMADGGAFISTFNVMFPLAVFSINVYAIIMLYFLDSHPVLFISHLILLPVTILVAAGISNAYESALSNTAFAVANTTIDFLMLNLPKVMLVFDILGGIALFTIIRQTK
jgi:hypothetical protein